MFHISLFPALVHWSLIAMVYRRLYSYFSFIPEAPGSGASDLNQNQNQSQVTNHRKNHQDLGKVSNQKELNLWLLKVSKAGAGIAWETSQSPFSSRWPNASWKQLNRGRFFFGLWFQSLWSWLHALMQSLRAPLWQVCSEAVIHSLIDAKREKEEESGSRCSPSSHDPSVLGPASFLSPPPP